jgi:hypothetical protein
MPTDHRLHIGVTGHRLPPKLPEASEAPLRALIDRIFAEVAGAARDTTIVSALAEGSDRIIAEAGLAAGFKLEAVLPFKRAEYMRDFKTGESRAEFEQLLARAAAVIELDGAADKRPPAYEAAGLSMLAKIGVLFAIWDGKAAAGIGGTEEIVGRALADGILVVWVEPTNPDAIRVSLSGGGDTPAAKAAADPIDCFHTSDVASLARAIKAQRR